MERFYRFRGLIWLLIPVLLTGAIAADMILQSPVITGALMMGAIVAGGTVFDRGATLAMAGAASLLLLATPLLSADSSINAIGSDRLIALVLLWLSAALLIWDPNRGRISGNQLQDAFADAPTGIAVFTADGVIDVANSKFCDLLGRPEDEVIEARVADLPGAGLWHKISSDEDVEIQQGEVTRADGSSVWVACYRKSMDREDGAQLVQLIDLTDQRNTQRALAKSEARFRNIVERSNELIVVLSRELSVKYANQLATETLSDDTPLTGTSLPSLTDPGSRGKLKNAVRRVLESGFADMSQLDLSINGTPVIVEARFTNQLSVPGIEGIVMMCREITYEVEAERQLHQTEARFSTIFHASPDAILILRRNEDLILDFNEGFTELLGYSREEAISARGIMSKSWIDERERNSVLSELEATGEIVDREVFLRDKHGDTVCVEISLRLIEIDGEENVLCIGRDVTQRVKNEATIRESEQKFAKVFSHSPDGICILRASDQTLYDINDVLLEGSGYHRDELIGKSIGDLNLFNDDGSFAVSMASLAREGSLQNRELTLRNASGEGVTCLVSATTIELGGEPYILAIIKDVSAQRRVEAKLRSSEERFRGVFENAPIGMLLIDTKGGIFSCNRFAAELLAYRDEDMIGTHISRLVPREDRRTLKDLLTRLTQENNVSRSERRMLSKNGLEIWTSFQLVRQSDDSGDASYYILQITDITESKRNHARMEQMAFYDMLTNLANRRLFNDRLQHAIARTQRSKRSAALLYLDLDQFKRVNDTLGHEAGDELLRQVAARLKECVRKEDTVARPGGDEFTILLYDIHSSADAGNVAEKILAKLRQPIAVRGHQLVVTTSIGITILPDDARDANTLTRNADLAMYNAKERGRNNYQFFSEEMNTNAITRLRTENEIRLALQRDEFVLFFQPKVSLKDQSIVGVESLIRWNHPERGLLSPDQFIEIAEETGVIVEIGNWVIEAACRGAVELNEAADGPITVALNISSRQFRDPGLINSVRRNLRVFGLDPSTIELEITETMLMHDVEAATLTLQRLHELGVRLAIDDFGTGYSSLNYLKRFPMNTVKVDRSFVKDIPNNKDDMAITAAVIAMAHRLNLEVVAEGVETREQVTYLAEQKCEYAQGYLFSRPVAIEELRPLLAGPVRLLGKQDNAS